jgi:hypothetical protein
MRRVRGDQLVGSGTCGLLSAYRAGKEVLLMGRGVHTSSSKLSIGERNEVGRFREAGREHEERY